MGPKASQKFNCLIVELKISFLGFICLKIILTSKISPTYLKEMNVRVGLLTLEKCILYSSESMLIDMKEIKLNGQTAL